MEKLGVICIKSYFKQLRLAIAICVVTCAAIGGHIWGLEGFAWGLLAGLGAPAALLWLAIAAIYVALYVCLFAAAWTVIFYGFFWLFSF